MINTFKKIIKNHYLAFVLAVFLGLITIGPNLFFIESMGDKYEGLYMMKADAQPYYTARIQEMYESNGMSNPFIYEHKADLPATPAFATAPIAYLGMAFGIEASTAALLSTFFLPIIISLLAYALFYQLTGSRFWSLSGATLIMCGGVLFNMPDLLHLMRLEKFYTQFTIWSRPVLPAMSSFVFFLYLNILLIAVRKNEWKWYLYLGAVFGLSFYIYFYNFTFLIVLNALLTVFFFVSKRREVSIKLFVSSLLGFLVGLYPIIYLYRVTMHPLYDFLSESLGLDSTRAFILSSGFLITVIIFALYLVYRKSLSEKNIVLLSLLATTFIVVNQQIITGKILQEGHYHWYFNVPVFSIVIIYVLADVLRNRARLKYLAGITLMSASLFASAFIQYSSYDYWHEKIAEDQRYMSTLRWFSKNTQPEDVVFANEAISELVPVFTNNNVVYDVQAYNLFWTKERAEFNQTYVLEDFSERIKKYKVDYVVWDTLKNPEWKMKQYDFLKKEFETNDLVVYKILKEEES